MLQKIKLYISSRIQKNSTYLGIKKGLSMSLLPAKVEKFYSNIFIRILRFIGGISFLIVISKIYLNLPENLHLFIIIIASIQITQIIIILIIKIFYGIYTLIYKKDKFEVRNSPLNKYESMIANILYCAKIGCAATGIGASFIAGGVAYDTLLVEAGYEKRFVPFMGDVYKGVFGEGPANKINSVIDKSNLNKETPIKEESVTDIVNKIYSFSGISYIFLYKISKEIFKVIQILAII